MKKDKKVLFVLTSHDTLGDTGEKTGFWVEEFAAPYYVFKDAGYNVTLASPAGGQPPIDPKSTEPDAQTPDTKRFYKDELTQGLLANTKILRTIAQEDYDAVFFPGGHGPMWDLANDEHSIALIESFNANNKPIAAVCHAPAIFKHTRNENSTFLVADKRVTGFSNTEEEAVGLVDVVPFLLEDMLQRNGAHYSKGTDWEPYVIEDGLLITGQNPASSKLAAQFVLKRL